MGADQDLFAEVYHEIMAVLTRVHPELSLREMDQRAHDAALYVAQVGEAE